MITIDAIKKLLGAQKKLAKHVTEKKAKKPPKPVEANNTYVGLYAGESNGGGYQSSSMVSYMMTSSAFFGSSSSHNVTFTNSPWSGQTSHGYYDAGVNNKKMVTDLEAQVAALKAELESKKLHELELNEIGDGKRVVEI